MIRTGTMARLVCNACVISVQGDDGETPLTRASRLSPEALLPRG